MPASRFGPRGFWLLKSVIRLTAGPALFLGAGILLIVLVGVAQRVGWISTASVRGVSATRAGQSASYICPMMCTPPSTEPGRCPVCAMELVAASSSGSGDGRTIVVDANARRITGITTTLVKSEVVTRRIKGVGSLSYDEGGLKTLSAYVDGRIDRLHKDFTGVDVAKGELIAEIYSPELYSAQVEFLTAQEDLASSSLAAVADANQTLVESSRQRLVELGMSQTQIGSLTSTNEPKSRLELFAPINGTVIDKPVSEGMYVKEGQVIYRLVDLSNVWLLLELLPEDAALIGFGHRVDVEVQSLPGESFSGRVAFVAPEVDAATRTVSVRVVLPNQNRKLRIGDFATGHIEIPVGSAKVNYDQELAGKWISPRHPFVISDSPGTCRLCGTKLVATSEYGFANEPPDTATSMLLPRSSVLSMGDTSIVYRESEPGRFEPQHVELGPVIGEQVVVTKGLVEGDKVALAGNFLIDSQMQLSGNPSLIDPARIRPADPMKAPPSPEVLAALESLPVEIQQRALAQKLCPVTGFEIGSMGTPPTVKVKDGREVFICCEGCRKPLLDDLDTYLAKLSDPEAMSASASSPDDSLPPIGEIMSLDDILIEAIEEHEDAKVPSTPLDDESIPEIGNIEFIENDIESMPESPLDNESVPEIQSIEAIEATESP